MPRRDHQGREQFQAQRDRLAREILRWLLDNNIVAADAPELTAEAMLVVMIASAREGDHAWEVAEFMRMMRLRLLHYFDDVDRLRREFKQKDDTK